MDRILALIVFIVGATILVVGAYWGLQHKDGQNPFSCGMMIAGACCGGAALALMDSISNKR